MKNVLLLVYSKDEDSLYAANAVKSLLDPDKFNAEICFELTPAEGRELAVYKNIQNNGLFWHLSSNILFVKYYEKTLRKYIGQNIAKLDKYFPDIVITFNPLLNPIAKEYYIQKNIPFLSFVTKPYKIHGIWKIADPEEVLVPFHIGSHMHWYYKILTYPWVKKETELTPSSIFNYFRLEERSTVCVLVEDISVMEKMISSLRSKNINVIFIPISSDIKHKISINEKLGENKNMTFLGKNEDEHLALLISDIYITNGNFAESIKGLTSGTMPYIYNFNYEELINLKYLEKLGLVNIGNISSLMQDIPIDGRRLEIFRENCEKFLEKTHILTSSQIFNNYLDTFFISQI